MLISMSFATPDPAVIARWGEIWTHTPAGGVSVDVRVYRDDDAADDQMPGGVLTLFGTIEDSGFESMPAKDDMMAFEGVRYRVYDVKSDWAGGTREKAGLNIHLALL